ncbi:hypothetical protein [Desulfovibrio sp.]|uniref:hypothetical protein n=1 Tax=Desulfovibrio sp. TaxID=885 RepID=UPI0023D5DCDD|nr:hypothetical protein [Desulfovibrio sp.]MDE7240364.1 hypothetical protein [Desulfovibrio sp.]
MGVPSTIDAPTIKNAFEDAPSVCAIFAAGGFIHNIRDAYGSAERLVMMASALDFTTRMIPRGRETCASPEG